MSAPPINEIVDRLCEDATNEYGWLGDGLCETALAPWRVRHRVR